MKEMTPDEIDIQILNILQKDARMPLKQVAKEVNLSSPAVSSRIQRLEAEGYITGSCACPKERILSIHKAM